MSDDQTQPPAYSVTSVEALIKLLDLDELNIGSAQLLTIADKADGYYSSFPLKKKLRPFARKPVSKKARPIDAPFRPLKPIQSRIKERILSQVSLPDYILGGVKGKSTTQNALLHQGARVLVTIDIKGFFSSITSDHIFYLWTEILGFSSPLAIILTKLTTHKGRLPQGAPTSTSLANIFIHSIDCAISKECERLGIMNSNWVDDLNFSGTEARQIIGVVVRTLAKAGLRVSRRKLIVAGPGKRKIVTGTVLGPSLSAPQKTRDQIRAGIYNLKIGRVHANRREKYIQQLRGRIADVKRINKNQGAKLLNDLRTVIKMAQTG